MSGPETLEALRAELDRERHARQALARLVILLREMVPGAFQEGFRMRQPEVEEPWLLDWLQSETKAALDPLFGPPPGDEAGGQVGGEG